MKTVDGFPIQDGFNFLPDKPDPSLNEWSFGKVVSVHIWYDDYWLNYIHGKYRKSITWKGETIVVEDYQWFLDTIWDYMHGYPKTWEGKPGLYHRPEMTKEQALDYYFELDKAVRGTA